MKLPSGLTPSKRSRRAASAAFTLVELMVSGSVGIMIAAGVMIFSQFAGLSLSGTTAQSSLAVQAGNALEFIQARVRMATSIWTDASGNTLTLGFDDDPATDSDGDGIPWDDSDHFEQFLFLGVNGSTNTISTNSLVYSYTPKLGSTNQPFQRVLITGGVHNLPGTNIFSVTYPARVMIGFGVVGGFARAGYHSIDVQGIAIPLNR